MYTIKKFENGNLNYKQKLHNNVTTTFYGKNI